MNWIGQYFLSVSVAAILCGLILSIAGKGICHGLVRLLCGVFLVMVMIHPVRNADMENWLADFMAAIQPEGTDAAEEGQQIAQSQFRERIREETEAYILKEASKLGAALEVKVEVEGENLPLPSLVTLTGSISPYAKEKLEKLLEQELGIAKENQRWIG